MEQNEEKEWDGKVHVGMPALLHLHEFGRHIRTVFGEVPMLVGSSLWCKDYRDVDVRVLVTDLRWAALFPDITGWNRPLSQWAIVCSAFSALGAKMTGLNIDFQIQDERAWKRYEGQIQVHLGIETPVNEGVVEQTLNAIAQHADKNYQ